eukprot:3597930-Prorocentrum_lima.AAC.1
MNDPGVPDAVWDSGASHVLLPAAGTSRAVVRLAVGDTDAIYRHEVVVCKDCRTPLIPATRVVNTLSIVAYISG